MKFVAHGGHCCGMAHIYGMPETPDTVVTHKRKKVKAIDKVKVITKEARIGFFRKAIIEIILAEFQMRHWSPALRRLGFKRVSKAVNPNSHNVIYVFHLFCFQPKPKGDK